MKSNEVPKSIDRKANLELVQAIGGLNLMEKISEYTNRQQYSKLLNLFSRLVVNEHYNEDVYDLLNNVSKVLDLERPPKEALVRLISYPDQLKEVLAKAEKNTFLAIEGIEGLVTLFENVDMDYNPVTREFAGRSHNLHEFIEGLADEELISKLCLISKNEKEEVYGGLVYALAMGDFLAYSQSTGMGTGPSDSKLIPPTDKILLAMADGLIDRTIDKQRMKKFTLATKYSLLKGCNYQDAGHYAGYVFDKGYKLSDYTKQHIKDTPCTI